MTRMTPCRLIILHLSHIGLTLLRTFMAPTSRSLNPIPPIKRQIITPPTPHKANPPEMTPADYPNPDHHDLAECFPFVKFTTRTRFGPTKTIAFYPPFRHFAQTV